MNKQEIINEIAKETGQKKVEIEKTIDAFLLVSSKNLAKGKTIKLVGFGSLIPVHKEARIGTHPATQEKIEIKSRNTVTFKIGKYLKELLN